MQITFTVSGVTEMSRSLRFNAEQLQRPAEFFRDAATLLEARTNQIWSEEGASLEHASPWPSLAPSTIKARERRWGYYKQTPNNPGVLRWTGNLQDHRNVTVNDDGCTIEFLEGYGPYHQDGSGDRPPQRKFADIDDATSLEIQRALLRYLNDTQGVFGRQA